MDWLQILRLSAQALLDPTTLGYAIAALGLALHFGFTGLLNMGVAAFMAIGAYGYAIFSLPPFEFPWYLAALMGVAGSALFAVVLGAPTLRLRGDYLAIATIAAAEAVRLLFLTSQFDAVTGSADGLSGFQGDFREANPIPAGVYGFGPWEFSQNGWWSRIVAIMLLVIALIIVWRLVKSPWGRVLKGIREDEDAIRSLGKNVFSYKMQALVIGGVLCGIAGFVISLDRNVNPGFYMTSLTFNIWTALLLGGAATVLGPLLGSFIFWLLYAFLGALLPQLAAAGLLFGIDSNTAANLRIVLIGVGLMLLVIFRPQGILGDKREMTFVR